MRKLVAGLFALVLGLTLATAHAGEATWLTSWKDAATKSKKEKKVIIADFTGSDWCGWCVKLKKEVFDTDEFKTWATKNAILLELDFPKKKQQSDEEKKQNAELRDKYQVKGYPTILFLDHEGNVLGKSGYKPGGPEGWIKDAEAQIAKKK